MRSLTPVFIMQDISYTFFPLYEALINPPELQQDLDLTVTGASALTLLLPHLFPFESKNATSYPAPIPGLCLSSYVLYWVFFWLWIWENKSLSYLTQVMLMLLLQWGVILPCISFSQLMGLQWSGPVGHVCFIGEPLLHSSFPGCPLYGNNCVHFCSVQVCLNGSSRLICLF